MTGTPDSGVPGGLRGILRGTARALELLVLGALLGSCSPAAPVVSVPPSTPGDAPGGFGGTSDRRAVTRRRPRGHAVEFVPGLVYATIDAGGNPLDLELDLYLPAATDAVPVLVFIHGGGWVEGERDGCPADDLVKAGYAVACIDYRLARRDCARWAIFPGAVLDIRSAVDWLRQHATEHGLDAARVGLYGDSAGGHLATLAGLSYGERTLATDAGASSMPVQAIVDWYGPSDLLAEPVQFEEPPCDTPLETSRTRTAGGPSGPGMRVSSWGEASAIRQSSNARSSPRPDGTQTLRNLPSS